MDGSGLGYEWSGPAMERGVPQGGRSVGTLFEREAGKGGEAMDLPLPRQAPLSPALQWPLLEGPPHTHTSSAPPSSPECGSAHLSAQLCPDPFWNAMPTHRPRLSISGPPQPPLFTAASTCGFGGPGGAGESIGSGE